MKYLLDTNTCVYLMKSNEAVVAHYRKKQSEGIAISVITAAELYYGVYNSAFPEKNGANLANFLIGVEILDFDSAAAMEYGRIRTILRQQGTPVGPMDLLIAAQAKSAGLTLVTNNTREFERVKGLVLADWLG
ncbi:MAG: type II toxin-antitoxin system VapC family toxin [Clostridiales bacterium]|jgi:tRNA(fMet)-specific endonuclease VapC|nr:type II toxin-antitoxin system VapC family toxin [Clostridiales bacterium]